MGQTILEDVACPRVWPDLGYSGMIAHGAVGPSVSDSRVRTISMALSNRSGDLVRWYPGHGFRDQLHGDLIGSVGIITSGWRWRILPRYKGTGAGD
jgi:hypothetical protein